MTSARTSNPDNMSAKNRRVALICLSMFAGMLGLAYASVPLYNLFCRVTGYGGTTQRVEAVEGVPIAKRVISVRFDANTANDLDWSFKPEKREVEVHLGQKVLINYIAENKSDHPIIGMATFNVTPQATGSFFNKIECFCFTDTRLEPGQKMLMPVVFYVDPDMDLEDNLKSLSTITLSYTFFESENQTDEIAAGKSTIVSGENKNGNL